MDEANLAKRVNVRKEPFNIYISGLDVSGTIDTTSRSDVNMIVTVNPKTGKIVLTSIPRDSVITMNDKGGVSDKLTHTGIYGIGCSLGAVENLTGLDMNYYVKVNYTTVKKVIDAIGGIDVKSDYEFDTHGMKAKFHFKKGMNHLDGEHALAFARERKSFPDGDIQRNRNQAKVMQAVIKKAASSTTILMNSTSILNSVKDYMKINMTEKEIKDLIKHQLVKRPDWKFKRQSLTGQTTFMQCYSTGGYNVSVVQVDQKSLDKCVGKIKKIMNPEEE
jgi:LCP family protein required for cell wall assembly